MTNDGNSDASIALAWQDGCAGRLHLPMTGVSPWPDTTCQTVSAALAGWREDPGIALLVLDSSGSSALPEGTGWAAMEAIAETIFTFPKPVISFLTGHITAPVGTLLLHASTRVVGMRMSLHLNGPATPRLGMSLLLAHLSGGTGAALWNSGTPISPARSLALGLADRCVPEGDWPGLFASLAATGNWKTIDDLTTPPPGDHLPGVTSTPCDAALSALLTRLASSNSIRTAIGLERDAAEGLST